MSKMKSETLRKCKEAISLVYDKEHSLRSAATAVNISSQTLYAYVEDYLLETEANLLRSISKQNRKKRA